MKLLLLVQNDADVAAIPQAAQAILRSEVTGVWVVFSPAITVNSSEASAKLDAEIAQLRTAEQQAAQRTDYEAAAGYKTQREGKELDKAKAVSDAWKTVSAEDRKARVNAIFKPFMSALQPSGKDVKITGHSDHYEREQWVAMLNSLSGVWFKPFAPGSFVIGWPGALPFSEPHVVIEKAVSQAAAQNLEAGPDARLNSPPAPPLSREAELRAMKFMSLKSAAKKAGVDVEGKGTKEIITAILEAEMSKPATPASTEAALGEY